MCRGARASSSSIWLVNVTVRKSPSGPDDLKFRKAPTLLCPRALDLITHARSVARRDDLEKLFQNGCVILWLAENAFAFFGAHHPIRHQVPMPTAYMSQA